MDSKEGDERKFLVAFNEFLGQIFFMYIVLVGSVSGSDTWGISGPLALFVMINIFGGVSGGHFNPAVSLGIYTRSGEYGKNLGFLLMYLIAQCSGAIVGMFLAWLALRVQVEGEWTIVLKAPTLLPNKFTLGTYTFDDKALADACVAGLDSALIDDTTMSMSDAFKCGLAPIEKNEVWEVTYMNMLGTFVFVLFILYVTGKKTAVPDLGTWGLPGICLNLWALCKVDWYSVASFNPALAIGASIF